MPGLRRRPRQHLRLSTSVRLLKTLHRRTRVDAVLQCGSGHVGCSDQLTRRRTSSLAEAMDPGRSSPSSRTRIPVAFEGLLSRHLRGGPPHGGGWGAGGARPGSTASPIASIAPAPVAAGDAIPRKDEIDPRPPAPFRGSERRRARVGRNPPAARQTPRPGVRQGCHPAGAAPPGARRTSWPVVHTGPGLVSRGRLHSAKQVFADLDLGRCPRERQEGLRVTQDGHAPPHRR